MKPIVALAAISVALQAADRFEAVEAHMGTLFRIELYARDEVQAREAFRAAFERIRQLDEILSDYQPDSELNRLARAAPGVYHPIGSDLLRVLAASQELSRRSGGAFDVTLGPLTLLWRQARKLGRPPDSEALAAALALCGYRKLHLDGERRAAMLEREGMRLDVGGIAKGYAGDEALAAIGRLGIGSALVAASGDLVFSSAPPGQPGWRIGIGSLDEIRPLANGAVSTSGPSEQHLDWEGRRYSHILDPATGMGLTADLQATVIAPDGALADGLATAICVLGRERGRKLAESWPGTQVFFQSGLPGVLK